MRTLIPLVLALALPPAWGQVRIGDTLYFPGYYRDQDRPGYESRQLLRGAYNGGGYTPPRSPSGSGTTPRCGGYLLPPCPTQPRRYDFTPDGQRQPLTRWDPLPSPPAWTQPFPNRAPTTGPGSPGYIDYEQRARDAKARSDRGTERINDWLDDFMMQGGFMTLGEGW